MFFGFFNFIFPTMFTLVFAVIMVMVIVTFIRNLREWNHNNHSPVLEVEAGVTAKRMNVDHHHHNTGDGMMHHTSSTSYYVTFQVRSGDRMEFCVPDSEYGMITEGDFGQLTFQGTRFIRFVRT